MTGKRPTPLKDELVTSPDELQELFAANLAATEALNRKLCGHSDTKPIDTEALKTAVATAARNAVKELLEERQRGFEREEKETKARGRLTPQECYERMAADFAEALDKYKLICDAFGTYRASRRSAGQDPRQLRHPCPPAGCQIRHRCREAGRPCSSGKETDVSGPARAVQGSICILVQRHAIILPP